MKTPQEGEREKRFLDLARSAHTHLFENDGDTTVEKILDHVIDADGKLWKAMQPQLAVHGALVLIKALVKASPHAVESDYQLDLFPNMPRLITFKKRKINLLKAGASELQWYGEWWNHRLEGLAKRNEGDLAISGEIERLKRTMKKYDPMGTVESALRIKNERSEAVRRIRERRRAQRRS